MRFMQTKRPNLIWDDVESGTKLPRIEIAITFTKVIQDAGATLDYFPGHHNPMYARAQGQKDIYINTNFFQGFIDRAVTDWSGPNSLIVRRRMKMQKSIYAGDTMYADGHVTKKYRDDSGRTLVEVELTVGNQNGVCCPALVIVWIPSRADYGVTNIAA